MGWPGWTSGADRSINGDVLSSSHEDLCALISYLDSDLGVFRSGGSEDPLVLLGLHGCAAVTLFLQGLVGSKSIAFSGGSGAAY